MYMGFLSLDKMILKTIFLLTVVMLVWFGTFGLLQHVNAMNTNGEMGGCLFNNQQDVCILSLSDHIALWQQMTAATPLINVLILAFLSAIVIFWRNPFRTFSKSAASRWRLYVRQHPHMHLFNALKEAFSAGILNRKVFVSVRV